MVEELGDLWMNVARAAHTLDLVRELEELKEQMREGLDRELKAGVEIVAARERRAAADNAGDKEDPMGSGDAMDGQEG